MGGGNTQKGHFVKSLIYGGEIPGRGAVDAQLTPQGPCGKACVSVSALFINNVVATIRGIFSMRQTGSPGDDPGVRQEEVFWGQEGKK